MKQITTNDLLFLLGQKEVELAMLRQQLAETEAALKEKGNGSPLPDAPPADPAA